MSEHEQIISLLDKEWEIPDGFFYITRQGIFDKEGYERVIHALLRCKNYINNLNVEHIDRNLVSALWYIPLYLSWQYERIEEFSGKENKNEYVKCCNNIEELMTEILGHP